MFIIDGTNRHTDGGLIVVYTSRNMNKSLGMIVLTIVLVMFYLGPVTLFHSQLEGSDIKTSHGDSRGQFSSDDPFFASNGENYDHTARPEHEVKSSTASRSYIRGKLLVDEGHLTLANGRDYRYYFDHLETQDFQINYTDEAIDGTSLPGHDVIVIISPLSDYSPGELMAIGQFITDGGGLIVTGDDDKDVVEAITSQYGIDWWNGTIRNSTTTNIFSHPVTEGITALYLGAPSCFLECSGSAQTLVKDENYNMTEVAIVSHGEGRVAVLTDELWFNDQFKDLNDNLLFMDNLLAWLSNVPPEARIWAGNDVLTYSPVLFDGSNSTDSDGTIEEYHWLFGDGNEYTETSQQALDGAFDGKTVHQYEDNGLYDAILSITDNNGAVVNVTKGINIMNRPPVPVITAPDSYSTIDNMILEGSSSQDMDGQIINYTWDVSGIIYSYRSIEIINFTQKGDYDIKLSVRDDDGAIGIATHTVSISDRAPVAKAFANLTSAYFNVPIEFNASLSFDFEGDIVSYQWEFGDGDAASGKVVTHKYRNSGMYSVILTVTDSSGNKDADQLTILIKNYPPTAIAGPDITTFACSKTPFSAYRCFDQDGDIVDYVWEFGDGSIGRGISLTHDYLHPGVYSATLSVFDNLGARAMDELTVTVVNYPPIPYFVVDPPVPLPGEAAVLDASGSMDPDGILTLIRWSIDNESIGEGYLLNHTFPEPGNYSVTLTVEDDSGAVAKRTQMRLVKDKAPIANAGRDRTVVRGTKVRFDGSGSKGQGDIAGYEWAFRDGDEGDGREVVLTGIAPAYTFIWPGDYKIILSVTDEGGNIGNDSVNVTVISSSGFHLVSTSPAPEETNVLPDTDIVLVFSAEVDRTSLDRSIRFIGHPPLTQFARFDVSDDGKTVTFDPVDPLLFGTRYEMFIPRNLTDTNDNELPCDINISFTVIPAFEIISHSLEGNKTGIEPEDPSITMTFNREPNIDSLRNEIRLLDGEGGEVDIEIEPMDDNLMISAGPSEKLGFGKEYTLQIGRSANCSLGGWMEGDFEVVFTTREAYPGELSKSSYRQTPKWAYVLEVGVIILILILACGYIVMRRRGKTTRDMWDQFLGSFRRSSGKSREDGTWDRREGGRRRKRADRSRGRRRPPDSSIEGRRGAGESRRRTDRGSGGNARRGKGDLTRNRAHRERGGRRPPRSGDLSREVVSFMVTGEEQDEEYDHDEPTGRRGRYYDDYDYSEDLIEYDEAPYSRGYDEYDPSRYGDDIAFDDVAEDEDEDDEYGEYDYECPDCGASLYEDDSVCPDCGAEFDGEELVDDDEHDYPRGRYSEDYDHIEYDDEPYGKWNDYYEDEYEYDNEWM